MRIGVTNLSAEVTFDTRQEYFDYLNEYGTDGLYNVPRRPNTFRTSLRRLPELIAFRSGKSYDELTDGVAKSMCSAEMQRRRTTEELLQNGQCKEYNGLWAHQNLGVALASVNPRFNFFYDTRTGKTRMAYQIMQNALLTEGAKHCVVFTPSSIIPSWLDDAKAFPQLKVNAYCGTEAQKREALSTPCHILLFPVGMVVRHEEMLSKLKFDICFFDESSKLKNHSSKISKSIMKLASHYPRWYNLSATPAPNGEHEYFTQMFTIDPYALGPTWSVFTSRYFVDVAYGRQWSKYSLRDDKREEFTNIMQQYSIYVDQSVMPIAEKHWHDVHFKLSDQEQAFYKEMKEELALSLSEETQLLADSAVLCRAKLSQITSGFIIDTSAVAENNIARVLGGADMKVTTHTFGESRLQCLYALLQELRCKEPGCSVVIWAHYAREFEMIEELLGEKCRCINGKTSATDRVKFIEAFRAKKFPFLVCHPLSVGMGINLTVSHIAVYYRVTDSWEAHKQSSERICGHVSVQPHDCEYYVITAITPSGERTIDGIVYKNVTSKRDASTGLLDYLRGGA